MSKRLREYRNAAEREGFRFLDWKQNGHLHLKLLNPNGTPVTVVTSVSPSDWRSMRAFRADLRRLANR